MAAQLLALEAGFVDARLVAALSERLHEWRSGALLPLSAAEYQRGKRDILLAALALTLAPHSGPATQARRVAAYLRSFNAGAVGRYSTPAERLAAELLELGSPIPCARQLQNVFASISAMEAAADFLLARQ